LSVIIRGQGSWWPTKIRQFGRHLRASVSPQERAALSTWLTEDQLRLFDSMHIADRRHGLDVVATLRADGVGNQEALLAGLLHDCGKGDTGVLPRVMYSLGQAYGAWVWRLARGIPGVAAGLDRLKRHAQTSADLAGDAGCSQRTVSLIRDQEAARDPEFGELLRLADEAN
jgi:hypothetical protein